MHLIWLEKMIRNIHKTVYLIRRGNSDKRYQGYSTLGDSVRIGLVKEDAIYIGKTGGVNMSSNFKKSKINLLCVTGTENCTSYLEFMKELNYLISITLLTPEDNLVKWTL